LNKKSFKSGFKNRQNQLCGSEFHTDGAETRKARPENGWSSSGMADERKVRLQVSDSAVLVNRSWTQCRIKTLEVLVH